MVAKSTRSLCSSLRNLRLTPPSSLESCALRCSMATVAPQSTLLTTSTESYASGVDMAIIPPQPNPLISHYQPPQSVPLTIFSFPGYEPLRLESWSAKHLFLPFRRDILHLAVIYEADKSRGYSPVQVRTRWEVHGSRRKLWPQKGMGRARVGDAHSPLRKGGGKSFGPRPRDFTTKITRKVYDLAWRTALSYRYRRGELVVMDGELKFPLAEKERFRKEAESRKHQEGRKAGEDVQELEKMWKKRWLGQMLNRNEWGPQQGRSTFIASEARENLFGCMDVYPRAGKALTVDDVDVKDLLETGRVIVERKALMRMIKEHQSDLVTTVSMAGVIKKTTPKSGDVLVGG